MKKNILIIFSVFLLCNFGCAKTKSSTSNIKESHDVSMVLVDGGEMTLGDMGYKYNKTHKVKISSFYCAKYLITIEDFKEFLEENSFNFDYDVRISNYDGYYYNPSDDRCIRDFYSEKNFPAVGFTWYVACLYCNWLSEKHGLEPCYSFEIPLLNQFNGNIVTWKKDANGYRLPTAAEWEYAARGGQHSKNYLYPGSNKIDEISKFDVGTYSVGKMKPNELGLYDMGGNVLEYCFDCYNSDYVPVYENPCNDSENIQNIKMRVACSSCFFYNNISKFYDYFLVSPFSDCFIGMRLVRNAD